LKLSYKMSRSIEKKHRRVRFGFVFVVQHHCYSIENQIRDACPRRTPYHGIVFNDIRVVRCKIWKISVVLLTLRVSKRITVTYVQSKPTTLIVHIFITLRQHVIISLRNSFRVACIKRTVLFVSPDFYRKRKRVL